MDKQECFYYFEVSINDESYMVLITGESDEYACLHHVLELTHSLHNGVDLFAVVQVEFIPPSVALFD